MAESMRNIRAAYNKGVVAYRRCLDKESPYGLTKAELTHWWFAGYSDASAGKEDTNLLFNKNIDTEY